MTDHPDLTVQQSDALWDAVAIPGPEQPTFVKQHERVSRVVAEMLQLAAAPREEIGPPAEPGPAATARLPRKIRRILHALDNAGRPLTGAQLCRITCHWPGVVYPALDRLERNGWIEPVTDPTEIPAYRLTERGRRGAGLPLKEQP